MKQKQNYGTFWFLVTKKALFKGGLRIQDLLISLSSIASLATSFPCHFSVVGRSALHHFIFFK